jgi:hypothetical protein
VRPRPDDPQTRKRARYDDKRRERSRAMELWQMEFDHF